MENRDFVITINSFLTKAQLLIKTSTLYNGLLPVWYNTLTVPKQALIGLPNGSPKQM